MPILEGRAFFRGELQSLAVALEGGRIARVGKTLGGQDRRDFGERLLLPGAVDLHVHFREPGMTHKEDFATGTAAAAVGGVTTVLDMPNTAPPVTSPSAYEEKLALVRRRAHVNFGLYGAIRTADDVRAFAGLAPAGKLYLAPTTGNLVFEDSGTLRDIVTAVAETGMLLTVHAEAPSRFGDGPSRTLAGYDRERPPDAEAEAIRMLAAADPMGRRARIHVAHATSPAALEALAATQFTAEVTPHHLL